MIVRAETRLGRYRFLAPTYKRGFVLESYTQICWVVYDLEKKVMDWVKLGAGPFFLLDSSSLPDREYRGSHGPDKFRSAHGFFGSTQIELIQPTTDEPSAFKEVLDLKGEAIHHLQPNCRVMDAAAFDKDAQAYIDGGLELIQTLVVPGIGRICFFDGLEKFGFFMELAERPPHIFQNSVRMYEAHLGWDGTDPMRPNEFATLTRPS